MNALLELKQLNIFQMKYLTVEVVFLQKTFTCCGYQHPHKKKVLYRTCVVVLPLSDTGEEQINQ